MSDQYRETLRQAAQSVVAAKWVVALTGAGISVDSGIPDFRSPGGLWTRFDPMEYGTIDAFARNPTKVWEMIKELSRVVTDARPNPGHVGLAELESMGYLKAVITQNIDNLHQEAGNKEVIEFHGNGSTLVCPTCAGRFSALEAEQRARATGDWPPECSSCGVILKPDVIFFGEVIPPEALERAHMHATQADLILVLGTSATVVPASNIPLITRQVGGKIIEFNLTETQLTPMAHLSVVGNTSTTVPGLIRAVRELVDR